MCFGSDQCEASPKSIYAVDFKLLKKDCRLSRGRFASERDVGLPQEAEGTRGKQAGMLRVIVTLSLQSKGNRLGNTDFHDIYCKIDCEGLYSLFERAGAAQDAVNHRACSA